MRGYIPFLPGANELSQCLPSPPIQSSPISLSCSKSRVKLHLRVCHLLAPHGTEPWEAEPPGHSPQLERLLQICWADSH